jgi:CRP/FNR family transcriptional regulator, cyclic AMP receptor protein
MNSSILERRTEGKLSAPKQPLLLEGAPDLEHHPLFHTLSPAHLQLLLDHVHREEFPAGAVLTTEGDCAYRCFLIESGRVAISHAREGGLSRQLHPLGPGDVVGWSWLFPPFASHFTVHTLERTRALVFDAASLLVICEKDHQFGYELMKRMAAILIRRLLALQQSS